MKKDFLLGVFFVVLFAAMPSLSAAKAFSAAEIRQRVDSCLKSNDTDSWIFWLQKGVELGYLEHARQLADIYSMMGISETLDELYVKMADHGDMWAMYNLFTTFVSESDYVEARKCIGKLRDNGFIMSDALEASVDFYDSAHSDIDSLRRCITINPADSEALFQLGERFYAGRYVYQDNDSAVHYYLKAAELGHPEAMSLYASCMFNISDDRDFGFMQSRTWFERAAKSGSDRGVFFMGVLYDEGVIYPRDNNSVTEFYEKASALGQANALYNYGLALVDGRYGSLDPERGVAMLQKAHMAKHHNAALALGNMFSAGRFVPRDIELARHYYEESAKSGNTSGLRMLAYSYAQGDNPDLAKVESYLKQLDAVTSCGGPETFVFYNALKRHLNLSDEVNPEKCTPEQLDSVLQQRAEMAMYNIGGFYTPGQRRRALAESAALGNEFSVNELFYEFVRSEDMDIAASVNGIDSLAAIYPEYASFDEVEQMRKVAAMMPRIDEIKAKASEGDLDAMFELGLAYHYGGFDFRHASRATTWIVDAASHGHTGAIEWLAQNYDDGNESFTRQVKYWQEKAKSLR